MAWPPSNWNSSTVASTIARESSCSSAGGGLGDRQLEVGDLGVAERRQTAQGRQREPRDDEVVRPCGHG
jgi:hypothetical protein